ncbi:inorganic diphosphatase [Belliella sp. DSM 107340]|uniref:inorganic diphosphatase n=1 Tax=Belliella calami TaxID=2923436 RepID=A0ABS9UJM8_9BACT|nr:inorganic diphosphatase [Belliella calami]MCH7396821.1 inorganic diphosphatase [Belliella calami]
MKFCYNFVFPLLLLSCGVAEKTEHLDPDQINLLHGIAPFTSDSLVNMVIEIPAGTNQKWEVNKNSGHLEWQKITADSSRVVDYLSYPANYGFVPQTLLSEATGGDGDPVDVFVIGESIERGQIVTCRIIGMIDMMDSGESDGKLIAVPIPSHFEKLYTIEDLENYYPGVLDILKIWLSNYKGSGKVEVLSVENNLVANIYLKEAIEDYIQKNEVEK